MRRIQFQRYCRPRFFNVMGRVTIKIQPDFFSGARPLFRDPKGDLYGTTAYGGKETGLIFEIKP